MNVFIKEFGTRNEILQVLLEAKEIFPTKFTVHGKSFSIFTEIFKKGKIQFFHVIQIKEKLG